METELSIQAFIANNWLELVVAGLWEAAIVFVAWRLDSDKGKLLALISLALFPLVVSISRSATILSVGLSRVEAQGRLAIYASEVEKAIFEISAKNPAAMDTAQRVYTNAIVELKNIANGRESVLDETAYFTVLGEELAQVTDGSTVWDVVMPLNPTRVGEVGRPPLLSYLNQVTQAISQRRIEYHLIIMPAATDRESIDAAMQRFRAMGVTLHVVDRTSLPSQLRSNFSIYESTQVVCTAERGDDATIIRGTRIRNDPREFERRMKTIQALRQYERKAKPEITYGLPDSNSDQ